MHPKAKLQNAPTFTGIRSHSHVSRNDYIDAYINFISVTCSPHNAKATISRLQRTNQLIPLLAKRLIIGHYQLLADYRCISTSDRLLNSTSPRAFPITSNCQPQMPTFENQDLVLINLPTTHHHIQQLFTILIKQNKKLSCRRDSTRHPP